MASMAMERVCVITAGKGHFVIPVSFILSVSIDNKNNAFVLFQDPYYFFV